MIARLHEDPGNAVRAMHGKSRQLQRQHLLPRTGRMAGEPAHRVRVELGCQGPAPDAGNGFSEHRARAVARSFCRQPVKFALPVRHPFRATNGFAVKLNGAKKDDASAPESFASLIVNGKTVIRWRLKCQGASRPKSCPTTGPLLIYIPSG